MDTADPTSKVGFTNGPGDGDVKLFFTLFKIII
jgi:hypothetical protein